MSGSSARSRHASHASRDAASAFALANSTQGVGVFQGGLEPLLEPLGVGEVQGARVLVFSQLKKVEPLADGLAIGQAFAKGFPAPVGLDDHVDLLYTVQAGRPPMPPVRSAGDAKGGYVVAPEGVAIAFSFYQNHIADLPRLLEQP